MYSIKEAFYTLQGEGANTGRPAIFCRFSGCNLWNGIKEDRPDAVCKFCDTDFIGTDGLNGGKFNSSSDLVKHLSSLWLTKYIPRFVVCTGGEPFLQLDDSLILELRKNDFIIAAETNGTIMPPNGIDWICVSPKANANIVVKEGDELKVVYPQEDLNPLDFADLNFKHFFIQPMDGENKQINTELSIKFCLEHPQWKLSLQTHKMLNLL